VEPDVAGEYLNKAGSHAKLAILMIETGLEAEEARLLLERSGGRLSQAIEEGRM